jgi:hypothetical protein
MTFVQWLARQRQAHRITAAEYETVVELTEGGTSATETLAYVAVFSSAYTKQSDSSRRFDQLDEVPAHWIASGPRVEQLAIDRPAECYNGMEASQRRDFTNHVQIVRQRVTTPQYRFWERIHSAIGPQ